MSSVTVDTLTIKLSLGKALKYVSKASLILLRIISKIIVLSHAECFISL